MENQNNKFEKYFKNLENMIKEMDRKVTIKIQNGECSDISDLEKDLRSRGLQYTDKKD